MSSLESAEIYNNKIITSLSLDEDILYIQFSDQTKIKIFDKGQDCCEYRHMSTDDELKYFVNSTLLDIKVTDGPDVSNTHDVHATQFLEIKTSKGVMSFVNHNEHNGYYGGFSVVIHEYQDN